MKRPGTSSTSRKSRRRGRASKVRTFLGMTIVALSVFMVVLTYLVDFKRLRADLGRWLTEIDAYERRADSASGGRPGP